MNKMFLIFLIFVSICSVQAHQLEDFLQANKAYENADYDTALQLYMDLENKGGGVYYNIGNSYFLKKDYVQALLYWKKAQRLLKGTMLRTVLAQIAAAEKKLGIQNTGFWYDFCYAVAPFLSYVPMLTIQCIWIILLFFILISGVRLSGYRRIIMVIVLLLGLLCIIGAFLVKNTILLPECALIRCKNTQVFAGPDEQYHSVYSLNAGNQVQICQQMHDWYKIKLDRYVGWVPLDKLNRI